MDPRRVLTFRAVAREGSFSRAAGELSLTQPSVSQQVAMLETELGCRLLDRGRGGLRLTRAGEVLLEHADQIAWRLRMADRQIAELSGELRDQIRIGAFPTALTAFVPAAVGRLRADRPDAQALLSELTPSTLEERFIGGDLDLAVSYQDSAAERLEIAGAERFDLLRETFLVGLPPAHRLARSREPLSLRELADEDWIVPSRDGFLIEACRQAGFEPRILAVTRDPIANRGLISRGLGVGWVPSLLADDFTEAVMRPVTDRIPSRDVFALLPPGERHPLARPTVDALVASAAEVSGDGSKAASRPRRRTAGGPG